MDKLEKRFSHICHMHALTFRTLVFCCLDVSTLTTLVEGRTFGSSALGYLRGLAFGKQPHSFLGKAKLQGQSDKHAFASISTHAHPHAHARLRALHRVSYRPAYLITATRHLQSLR